MEKQNNCKCGCGKVVKPGNQYIYGHNKGNLGKHWKLTGQALKNHNEAMIKNGLKRKGQKRTGQALKNIQKANRRPERIRKQKQTWEKKIENGWISSHKGMKYLKDKYPNFGMRNKKQSNNSIQKMLSTKISQSPYRYKNIRFESKHELECFKTVIVPINIPFQYQICMTGGRFDFCFFDKNGKPILFWDPHPSNRWWTATSENVKIYTKERRKILDNNGYKDIPLIVTTEYNRLDLTLMLKIKNLLKERTKEVNEF